ncbi:MAG: hypothetical protein H6704_20660 [Myxococcales bacterium]|nr:hypothetical protein [Myxococcales bacterium]
MSRPDPHQIARRPMVRAGVGVPRHATQARAASALFTADGRLDVDALHRLVELAPAVSEGQAYPGPGGGEQFLGSTVLTLDPAAAKLPPLDADGLARLADALAHDPRARHVLRDRVYREMARLLGPDTPDAFDFGAAPRVEGDRVHVVGDFEATLERRAVTDGRP